MQSLNSKNSTNLGELIQVSRVWWKAIYKFTILNQQHWISSKVSTNSSRGSSCASWVFFTADAVQAVWLII
jgi:hypothetical protein